MLVMVLPKMQSCCRAIFSCVPFHYTVPDNFVEFGENAGDVVIESSGFVDTATIELSNPGPAFGVAESTEPSRQQRATVSSLSA